MLNYNTTIFRHCDGLVNIDTKKPKLKFGLRSWVKVPKLAMPQP